MMFYIIITLIFLPCTLLVPIRKIGKKNLKQLKKNKQNYIVSCNHMSNWDPVMMDITFGKKHRFLAKKELFSNKFLAWFMRSLGAVPVDRTRADTRAVKEIFTLLKKKKPVCIFPQGTRAKTVKIEGETAKEGVAMFSLRTDTPVVPMMFVRKNKLFRRNKLIIGEPIYPDVERKKDKAYMDEYANLIINKMNALIDGEQK